MCQTAIWRVCGDVACTHFLRSKVPFGGCAPLVERPLVAHIDESGADDRVRDQALRPCRLHAATEHYESTSHPLKMTPTLRPERRRTFVRNRGKPLHFANFRSPRQRRGPPRMLCKRCIRTCKCGVLPQSFQPMGEPSVCRTT
jgi:hypothetical protein